MAVNSKDLIFKKFANLLIRRDGTAWITEDIEYPLERRWNRKTGECDGYAYVTVNGGKKMSLHSIVAKTWLVNPLPGVFDRVDHRNRDRWNSHPNNLRFTSAHLNAINRENVNNTKFDYDLRMWYSSFWVRGEEIIVGWFRTFREAHRENLRRRQQIYDQLEQKLLNSE